MNGEQQKPFRQHARALGDAPKAIKIRHISNCLEPDPAYGGFALGIPLTEAPN